MCKFLDTHESKVRPCNVDVHMWDCTYILSDTRVKPVRACHMGVGVRRHMCRHIRNYHVPFINDMSWHDTLRDAETSRSGLHGLRVSNQVTAANKRKISSITTTTNTSLARLLHEA